jgi:signal transduction histidine kinase
VESCARELIVVVPDGRARTVAVLRDEGYEVEEVGTAPAVLALTAKEPDLVLLDARVSEAAAAAVRDGLAVDPVTAAIPVLHLRTARRRDVLAAVSAVLRTRRAERALREAAELRAVTALAVATAHEINNPLTVVTGQLEMLAREQPALASRVRAVRDAAYRIADVVARMRRIRRLRLVGGDAPSLPEMLDLDACGAPSDETPPAPRARAR